MHGVSVRKHVGRQGIENWDVFSSFLLFQSSDNLRSAHTTNLSLETTTMPMKSLGGGFILLMLVRLHFDEGLLHWDDRSTGR